MISFIPEPSTTLRNNYLPIPDVKVQWLSKAPVPNNGSQFFSLKLNNSNPVTLSFGNKGKPYELSLYDSQMKLVTKSNKSFYPTLKTNSSLPSGQYYAEVKTKGSFVVYPDLNYTTEVVNGKPIAKGKEAQWHTLKIKLQPIANGEVEVTSPNYITCDANNNLRDGISPRAAIPSVTETSVACYMEIDDTGADRPNDTIKVTVFSNGSPIGDAIVPSYTINTVGAPNKSKFNITLDYRGDQYGYWTDSRKALARAAADQLEQTITRYFPNNFYQKESIKFPLITPDGFSQDKYLYYKGVVDDVFIIMQATPQSGLDGVDGTSTIALITRPENSQFPVIGTVMIFKNASDSQLQALAMHEMMHVLGIVGRFANNPGTNYVDKVNGVYTGPYSKAANGNQPVPLLGPSYAHTASSIFSVMSYWDGITQPPSGTAIPANQLPTAMDKALLGDHGWCNGNNC
jgi:hypothetical protein